MKKSLLTIISISLSLFLPAQDTQRKVLFIGIDGCRYDAVAAANTPANGRLLRKSILEQAFFKRIAIRTLFNASPGREPYKYYQNY
jgi:hypothetical protein